MSPEGKLQDISNILHNISYTVEEKAIFLSPLDKSTELQEDLSHSTTSTSTIPKNSESRQFFSLNDLTLSKKETSKSFVGSSRIFGLPDLTSPVYASSPVGKRKRKKLRITILTTNTRELAKAKEARHEKSTQKKEEDNETKPQF